MSRPVCISEIENGIEVSDLIMQMMMHVMGKLQVARRGLTLPYSILDCDQDS